MNEFVEFRSIPRLFRTCTITEKIDGTNAQVHVLEDGTVLAGSRTLYITPEADNFGFAAWVKEHEEELRQLGPGRHFGEWYGAGIQRKYGLDHKRFALFNTFRWGEGLNPQGPDPRTPPKARTKPPACCEVVPILYEGPFTTDSVKYTLDALMSGGSRAVPGWDKPEGIVIHHDAGGYLFKVTDGGDGAKGARR